MRIDLLHVYYVDFGGLDPNVVYGTQRLLLGEPLYQNPEQSPYAIIQYMPIYYHLCAWLAAKLGIHALGGTSTICAYAHGSSDMQPVDNWDIICAY